ncbi:NACHT domain-containing protein [Saccharothrix stipae]
MSEPGASSSNDFSGTADNVVQVGTLYGNVVFADSAESTHRAKAFEDVYRRGIHENLNRVVFFGRTREWAETFRLTEAYVELSLTDLAAERGGLRVDDALAGRRRLLLEGSAGTGKSTVLRKLAIRALRGELSEEAAGEVAGSPGPVPFLLKLRSFVRDDRLALPEPEDFVAAVARPLVSAKPGTWVSRLLESGRALVLVDGIDEVREVHRGSVLAWVRNLIDFYPDVGFVVTARPAAVPEAWRKELRGLGFATARLEPMNRRQVNGFIDNWHRAMGIPEWSESATELKEEVAARRDLSSLATSPLLCGVLCAIHADHRTSLPSTRHALYETGLSLLLERRDQLRGFRSERSWQLPRSVSQPLLGRIALWMVLNGQDSIPATTALTMVERTTADPPHSYHRAKPLDVLHDVVEQTGIMRRSGPDSLELEFSLSSFQDYFAAVEIIKQHHVKHLVLNAHNPTYHDVVIMTAELADEPVATDLLTGLVERAEAADVHRRDLWLLAAACVANIPVPPPLRDRIGDEARRLLPPTGLDEAHHLAGAGGFVLDLLIELARTREFTDAEAAASIRAASLIDPVRTRVLLEHFSRRSSPRVRQELAAARSRDSDT